MTTDLVKLKIDGLDVEVPKGTNLLEAAKSAEIEVPFFCYHPGLSSPAVCRQCLVSVKGMPKLVPACYTPVSEGMDVTTSSPQVLTARRQMLEFTLVNHPVDCPICDKAGECHLQKLYQEWDHRASRLDLVKVRKDKVVDVGPHIVLDQERCILCTRCIRVCNEVAKEPQLTMARRGDREILTTAPGQKLDNAYSLNTVDVCPVGALTAKDFRFSMRAWELSATPSVCNGCSTGCNLEIHTSKGRIHRLVPRKNPDVNQYWMCDEGRFTYKLIHEGRLAVPRLGNKPAAYDAVLGELAGKLEAALAAHGASVGLVLTADMVNEDAYALRTLAVDHLGIGRVYVVGSPAVPERDDKILRTADINANTRGVRAIAGPGAAGAAELAADLRGGALKALIVLGNDLPGAMDALSGLELLVVLGTHDGELARAATLAVPIAAWAEVDATITNRDGRTQRLRQALPAPGAVRPGWRVVRDLARKTGATLEHEDARAVFAELAARVTEFAGAEFGRDVAPFSLRFAGSRG